VLRELVYTGRQLGAEEAAALGLVNGLASDREAAMDARSAWRAPSPPSPARHCRRQAQPQLQPRPPGRGGPARRRLWNAGTVVSADLGRRHPGAAGEGRPSFGR
jgi:hypothetical protein